MGNDGGSIPKRRELVKEAARAPTISELKATALESLSHAWTHDPLSSEPLDLDNTVSDCQGRLYNYESVLKGLMPGDDGADAQEEEKANGHDMTFSATGIKSLRDIVRLKFKRYTPAGSNSKAIWACPISLKELGPATKAVYIVPCGHVFADAAMKEITTDQDKVCPECSETFEEQDVVSILPTDEADVQKLQKRMEGLRSKGLAHSKKQNKSAKKKKRKAGDVDGAGKDGETERQKKAKSSKTEASTRTRGINNPMTASLTAKVLAEQEERNKRRKLAAASG